MPRNVSRYNYCTAYLLTQLSQNFFVLQKCGIEQLLPMGTLIDDELFDPCGYSLNGIIPNSVRLNPVSIMTAKTTATDVVDKAMPAISAGAHCQPQI